jgi:hypothetical protein
MDIQTTPLTGHRPVRERTDIPGWGVDADPRNDPTYPMRDRSQDDSPGMNWTRPTQQSTDVEILQSIEHERRPAVFGASTPPTGLSGAIRRRAFAYSESQWAHWLLLMAADRINAVEGLPPEGRHDRGRHRRGGGPGLAVAAPAPRLRTRRPGASRHALRMVAATNSRNATCSPNAA